MAIKIRCPNEHCNRNLNVQDEAAGKKCECPACGLIFLVPIPKHAFKEVPSQPVISASRRPATPPEEEEVVILEPEPDEPKRRAKSSRQEDAEETDRRSTARKRRDEDYEDDEDGEEDSDDRDDRRSSRMRSRQLKHAKLGVLLTGIGAWFYVGATCILFLLVLLFVFEVRIDDGFYILAGLPGLANWVLAIIGLSFCIAGPARYGARGLAIATLAVAAGHLLTMFVIIFTKDSISSGPFLIPTGLKWLPFASSLPILPFLLNPDALKAIDSTWPLLLTALLELTRWILLLLYLRALAKNVKNDSIGDDAMMQVIVVPSTLGVLFFVDLIFGLIAKSVKSVSAAKTFLYIFKVLFLLNFLAVGLLAIWLAIHLMTARQNLQYRKS
jgi:hypothetical protein